MSRKGNSAHTAMGSRSVREAPVAVQLIGACLAALLPWAGLIKTTLGLSFPIDATAALVLVLAIIGCVQFAFELVVPWSLLAVGSLFVALALGLTHVPLSAVADDKITRLFILTSVGVAAAAVTLRHERQTRAFIHATLLVTGALAVTSLLLGNTVGDSGRESLGTTPVSTGQVAGAFSITLLALLVARRIPAWFALTGAVLGTVACLATGSRGPVVALMAATCVLLLAASANASVRRLAVIGGALVVLAFVAVAFVPDQALGRIGIVLSGDPGTSGEARIYLGRIASQVASENPLTGIGWGNLNAIVPPALGSIDQRVYAHNLVLEVASEAGLIAAVVVVGVLVYSWWRGWQSRRSDATLTVLTLFTYLLVAACFSGDLNDNRGVLVLMVATLNSAWCVRQRPQQTSPVEAIHGATR
jgi:O-antigen ligase